MNELASLLFLASALTVPSAPGTDLLRQDRPAITQPQLAQFPLGQVCLTRIGSCIISPRPINTQCFCGNVPGVVR